MIRSSRSQLSWLESGFTSRREKSERRCELCRLLQFGFGAARSSCTPIGLFGSCQTCSVAQKTKRSKKSRSLLMLCQHGGAQHFRDRVQSRKKKTHDQHTTQRMLPIHSHSKIARAHQRAVVWRAICSRLELRKHRLLPPRSLCHVLS